MSATALKFDDSSAPVLIPGHKEADAGAGETVVGESLFETFVDEIDAWARRALAANGFGDSL